MPNPKNKVKYGLKNVYYAVHQVGEDGAITFATPVAIPGAVNLNLTAQGEITKFYADNMAYYVSSTNDGYQGDLEIALIPESFHKDVLKEELDETDQVLTELSNVETAGFALLFEFAGDVHGVRHILYNCTVTRPNVASSTTSKTKEPSTDTMTITAAPLADGRVKVRTTADTPEETYNNWFQSVWEKAAAA